MILQKIRKKISNWFIWIFIIISIIIFSAFGINYFFNKKIYDKDYIAIVNNEFISRIEFLKIYENYKNQFLNKKNNKKNILEIKNKILKKLIINKLLIQHIKNIGMTLSNQYIDSIISNFPIFQKDKKFSLKKYHKYLEYTGLNTNIIRKNLLNFLIKNQFYLGIKISNFAMPNEIKRQAILESQIRNFRYIKISDAKFNKFNSISDNEKKKYYNSHKELFFEKPKIKIAYLIVFMEDIINSVNIKENEIQDFYKKNSKKYFKDFNIEKIKIKKYLKYKKSKYIFNHIKLQLNDLSQKNPHSLSYIASILHLKIINTGWISKNNKYNTGIFKNPKLIDISFSDRVFKKGYNSKVIYIPNLKAILVLRIIDYNIKKIKKFNAVKNFIEQKIKKEKSIYKVNNIAINLVKNLNNNKNIYFLMKKFHLKWIYENNISLHSNKMNFLTKKAFSQIFLKKCFPYKAIIFRNNHYFYILQVTKIHFNEKPKISLKYQEILRKKILNIWFEYEYNKYISNLYKNASIKYNL